MTREEAVIILDGFKNNPLFNEQHFEALDMAISALSAEPCREADDYENEIADLHNRLDIAEYDKERYKEEITILEAENKEEWIPVSERLPDNNVRVLCSAISTSISGGYTRFVGCCDNGDWFVQTDAETVSYPRQYEVTAWMPLPEPYHETCKGCLEPCIMYEPDMRACKKKVTKRGE